MRHGVKSVTYPGGSDANKMLLRKLIVNFLSKGTLVTTVSKAKFMKPTVERLVEKAKNKTEANKNYLLRYVAEPKIVDYLFSEVGPAVKHVTGGYVRVSKVGYRPSDGAPTAQVTWAYPVMTKKVPVKPKETPVKVAEPKKK